MKIENVDINEVGLGLYDKERESERGFERILHN